MGASRIPSATGDSMHKYYAAVWFTLKWPPSFLIHMAVEGSRQPPPFPALSTPPQPPLLPVPPTHREQVFWLPLSPSPSRPADELGRQPLSVGRLAPGRNGLQCTRGGRCSRQAGVHERWVPPYPYDPPTPIGLWGCMRRSPCGGPPAEGTSCTPILDRTSTGVTLSTSGG